MFMNNTCQFGQDCFTNPADLDEAFIKWEGAAVNGPSPYCQASVQGVPLSSCKAIPETFHGRSAV